MLLELLEHAFKANHVQSKRQIQMSIKKIVPTLSMSVILKENEEKKPLNLFGEYFFSCEK